MDLPARRRLMNSAAQPAPRIHPPLTFPPSIVRSLLFFPHLRSFILIWQVIFLAGDSFAPVITYLAAV